MGNIKKYSGVEELLSSVPKNEIIGNNLAKAFTIINRPQYKKIICAISGGSDSDIMLDICYKCDKDNKIDYVWCDTGLEYQATKDHLKYLEEKYEIEIRKAKAIKSIPSSCKEFGEPFLSKRVSDYMSRLQAHNFQWEDEPLDTLLSKYCKWSEKTQKWRGCKTALFWWCNANGEKSQFNISRNKWLKEFIVANPPNFKISDKCCEFAKKKIVHNIVLKDGYDLSITGIRKAEGGVRSTAYKNCFDEKIGECDNYRPIFWYTNQDKKDYINHYNITYSDCYLKYGLTRTGCAGCPFSRDYQQELKIIDENEPKLYKAVNNIFKNSYEYTKKYRAFYEAKNNSNA